MYKEANHASYSSNFINILLLMSKNG